ncbi:GNAT family N-acetyltransferase [Sphaerisporangium album]|uniref:GNAT family N-acetyltransferase n=2 Tax=Sphaerisporangium album TaxID=509200 RepID=A0A367EXX5_9ACTN|nr:GNAT family N-acetyltransferase [Sphaerisporangium album]
MPAIGELAREALALDAEEAPQLVARLAAPPEGRAWTALVTSGLEGVVFASTSSIPGVGHVDLLAVRPPARCRGLGRALVVAAEGWLREHGVREARLAANPPCYAWPGIDVRYTPAILLAESLGYERYRVAWNMTVDLAEYGARDASAGPPAARTGYAWGPSEEDDLARLAAAGATVRAAPPGGRDEVVAFARENWNDAWAWEAEHATGCHYAVRGGEILGFAAWGARPLWFGPMGTAESARGLGVGSVLLRRCLREMTAAGQRTAQIGWVGPLAFYAKTAGAWVERAFWLYNRSIP